MIKEIVKVKLSKEYNGIPGVKKGNIFFLNVNFKGSLQNLYILKFH